MPVWAWILLIAALSALAIASVGLIVRGTHKLPRREPLHGDPEDFAAPVPLDVAERDSVVDRDRAAV
ncbi:MAG TPA: hypothetical protein VFJ91_05790 [Gaiellaceae bacterium]|nr:hypothetical protein [Gaiellaceae bacterium]